MLGARGPGLAEASPCRTFRFKLGLPEKQGRSSLQLQNVTAGNADLTGMPFSRDRPQAHPRVRGVCCPPRVGDRVLSVVVWSGEGTAREAGPLAWTKALSCPVFRVKTAFLGLKETWASRVIG